MTVPSQTERALVCPNCGRIIYPRILPAVIIAVTDKDRMIMTKYAGRSLPFYALVAGFNEIGESLEETVKREVMEEVGLKVKNIRYYKSQPWGIVDDILTGYYCDVDGSTEIRMDRTELKEAVWMERKEIKGQPHDLSLTNEMMITFRDGKEPLGYRYAE
jgi:NAD+ diphosphatase